MQILKKLLVYLQMSTSINSQKLVSKAKKILDTEGETLPMLESSDELQEFVLPGMKNSKDTMASIYFKSRDRKGLVGKIKTKIQTMIINTVINVIEKQSMKQQKFNTLTYKAIETLVEENTKLKEEIEKIKDKRN